APHSTTCIKARTPSLRLYHSENARSHLISEEANKLNTSRIKLLNHATKSIYFIHFRRNTLAEKLYKVENELNKAETFLSVILEKIKVERGFMGHDLLQSLCRVYVGVCQQRGDSHKAHALAYRLLKEDFLKAPKVIMGMVTAWPSFLSHERFLCRAIHIVSNLKAKGKIFHLLTKYLHWDEVFISEFLIPPHLFVFFSISRCHIKYLSNCLPYHFCSSSTIIQHLFTTTEPQSDLFPESHTTFFLL
ncbi:little elongation complex subunit 1, partial [Silurus meridionalis]